MTSPPFEAFFNRLYQATDIENQSQLAQVLGVGRAAISLAKQKNAVPWKWVFTLAETYNLNSTWLATGNGVPRVNPDLAQYSWIGIPHAQAVGQDDGRLELEKAAPRCALPLQTVSAQTRVDLVSLEMTGPSMEPEIKDMDLLLVDRSLRHVRPGLIYALDLCGRLLIRRIDVQPRGMTLICDNQTFPPMALSPEDTQQVKVVGQVIGLIRQCNFRLWPTDAPDSTSNENDISFSYPDDHDPESQP